MNIVIPMAGIGSRFANEGYKDTKPLIPVHGKPMIQRVIENLYVRNANYVIILNKLEQSARLKKVIKQHLPEAKILYTDLTDGPARTALLCKDSLVAGNLIIVNCDQIIEDFNIKTLVRFAKVNKADGVLGTFISTSPKKSYVKLDDDGKIIEVREKIVISNIATNGLHYWKKWEDFVDSATRMIDNEEKYVGEYYVAPTYNYMIEDGKKVLPFFYNLHHPIGTPEDLVKYESIQD